MVDEALLALAAERAGIVAGNGAVQREILDEKSFQDANGKFDKNQYALALQSMNMTRAALRAAGARRHDQLAAAARDSPRPSSPATPSSRPTSS